MNAGNYIAATLLIALGTGTGIYAYNTLRNSPTDTSSAMSVSETTGSGTQKLRVEVSSDRIIANHAASENKPFSAGDRPSQPSDREFAIAVNQSPIERLLETNACPGCDLREANLAGVDLSGANLSGANLSGANLTYTRLDNANLKGANLSRTNLEGADLGCNVSFNLPRQSGGDGFSVHSYSNGPGSSNVNVDVNINRRNARVDVNASGDIKDCVVLRGTNLKEARLPDGSIYQ